MMMIARTQSGGKDLCHGSPNLDGATIISADSSLDDGDYCTILTIEDKDSHIHHITIKQER